MRICFNFFTLNVIESEVEVTFRCGTDFLSFLTTVPYLNRAINQAILDSNVRFAPIRINGVSFSIYKKDLFELQHKFNLNTK